MNIRAIRLKQQARKLIVQALYQKLIGEQLVSEIHAQFEEIHDMEKVDLLYFQEAFEGIITHLEQIDELLIPCLDRPLKELQPVELCVLRLGCYELLFAPEIPYRIILDEAINLSKLFGSQDGHRYVNGVLHKVATQIRSVEMKSEKK